MIFQPAPALAARRSHRSFSRPLLQRECACGDNAGAAGECKQCREKRSGLQHRADCRGEATGTPPIVRDVSRSSGQPLADVTRVAMESRFAHDFSRVRIHSDAKAAASARSLAARAYTVGQDIAFSEGQYTPHLQAGAELLAHELAHVIQQGRGGPQPSSVSDRLERDAESATSAFRHDQPIQVRGASSLGVARQPLPGTAKHLREVFSLDPRKIEDRQLASELDVIEALLLAERSEWTDTAILAKAVQLNKYSGGKFGGAVLAYYDQMVARAVGGALAQASAPVVVATDPAGNQEVLVRGYEAAQAPAKFQQQVLLGLLEGFAKAGAFGAAGLLAAEVALLAALAAPALLTIAGRATLPLTEGGTALAFKGAPRLMLWAARTPYVAEAAVTGGVAIALDLAETGSVNPIQILFTLAHMYGSPGGGGGNTGSTTPPKPSPKQWIMLQRLAVKIKLDRGAMRAGAGGAAPIQGVGSEPAIASVQPRTTAAAQPRANVVARRDQPARATAEKDAVPQAISDEAPTQPIPDRGAKFGELVGEYRVHGDKALKGQTFERNIWGLAREGGPAKTTDIGPITRLFDTFIKEARAAGATQLRITGNAIRNKNVLRMRLIIEKLGGKIRTTGSMSNEIIIQL